MAVRDRVRMAIETSVGEAEKTLAETPDVDDHARLSILLNGWFRGLAGAIEEIAVELDSRGDDPSTTRA
jgi:hypothetical protein